MVKSGSIALISPKMSNETQTLYAGTFERAMDAKKRVGIPSVWLGKKEGDEFYAVLPPDGGFLMVMPAAELMAYGQKFEQSDLPPPEKRVAIREFYGGARRLLTDGQGRVLLPEEHCAAAGLKSAVVFVGGRSRFEIWDKDRYAVTAEQSKEAYRRAALAIGL